MVKKSLRHPQALETSLTPIEIADLLWPAHLAVSNLQCSCFSAASWRDLVFIVDIAQLLAAETGNQSVVDFATDMGRCLLSIRERRGRIKVWGATGDELKAMRKHINALDVFLRQQPSYKIIGAQMKRRAALVQAQEQGNSQVPLELNGIQLKAVGKQGLSKLGVFANPRVISGMSGAN